MFQYTHELVLNSINEAITKFANGKLTVERGGEYAKAYVQGGVIWQSNPVEGAFDKWTLDVSKLNLESGKNYALSIFVKLVDPHALFEYGYPNYNSFGKQVLVDFVSSGTAATDAVTILDSILPQIVENDLTFLHDAGSSSTNVVLEVGHYGLRIDSMALAEYDPTTCDSCIGEYLTPKSIIDHGTIVSTWGTGAQAAVTHTTTGVDPFATGQWLIENLRFPSYPNIRYHAIGKGNQPIASEKYTMFSFAYESPRPGLGGLSGVGQKMEAVTRHIYYVRGEVSDTSSPAYAFATLLGNLGTVTEVTSSVPEAATPKSDTGRLEKAVNELVAGAGAGADASNTLSGLKTAVGEAIVTDTALQTAIVSAL